MTLVAEKSPHVYRDAWIGGRHEMGIWKWADGSVWNYTNWDYHGGDAIGESCLMQIDGGQWAYKPCNKHQDYVCQYKTHKISGTTSLSLRFEKEKIHFTSFNMFYNYENINSDKLYSWIDKRMTGFQITWSIENQYPPMKMTTNEVGKSVQTPSIAGQCFNSAPFHNPILHGTS